MRALLALLALPLCGCLATSGDLDGAVADITERIEVVARSAEESAAAARGAWERGEITYADLQKRLQDIRAATLDVAKETTTEVLDGLKETMESRPEVVAQATGDVLGQVIPGVPGELLGMIGTAAAAYFAATRKSKKDAEDAVWDARYERKEEALARLERGKK